MFTSNVRFKFLKTLSLVILPTLLLIVALLVKNHAGPYWLSSNFDPDYAYLFNSLNLAQVKQVGHFDHPGTPLQLVGAGVLLISHISRQNNNLVLDVLGNPEFYLNSISYTLILLIVLSVFIVGIFTWFLTKNLLYAIIIQTTPFLSGDMFLSMNRVSPEPLLLFAGVWFSYLVLYVYYKKGTRSRFPVVILSIISGFLVATKINSIPLIVIPIVFLLWKDKILYFLTTFISLVFFTLPIYKHYYWFIDWTYNLFIHAGIYGEGETSIVDLKSFVQGFSIIIKEQRFLSISVLAVFIALIVLIKKWRKIREYKYLLGLFLAFLLQIIIVAKHFHMHYLVPALSLMGLSSILILILVNTRLIKYLFTIFIFFSVVVNIITAINKTKGFTENYKEFIKINNFIKNNYNNIIKITYYRSSSIEYALNFGNDYALSRYNRELSQLYPNQYFYNIWNGKYYNWGQVVLLPLKKPIIFQGYPFREDFSKYKPPLEMKDVYSGIFETVYLVTGQ